MKKLLITLLTVFMLLGMTGCNSNTEVVPNDEPQDEEVVHSEGKYPTEWDDTEFYKNEEEFDADLEKLRGWCDAYQQYKGKLNTVDGLLGYFEVDNSRDFNTIYDRLNSYAVFGSSVYPAEAKYQKAKAKLAQVVEEIFASRDYIDEEMATLSFDERWELFSDEKLMPWAEVYYQYLYEDISTTDDDLVDLYNNATLSHGNIKNIFNTFVNVELQDVEYTCKDGTKVLVNNSNVNNVVSENYDFADKVAMNDLWYKNAAQYKYTLTSLIQQQMMEQYSDAKVNGYQSTKYQQLSNLGAQEDIIQKIIDFAYENHDALEEYYQLFADKNGKYYTFSKFDQISDYNPGYIEYDTSVDIVLDGLKPMGDEYVSIMRDEFNSGHVDVYPKPNKVAGAFENGDRVGQYPYVVLNYLGSASDSADIAHEMGHAGYDILCNANQETYNWGSSIFTHEVASITNELMIYQYLVDNAKTDEEKMFHLQNLIGRWTTDLYNGCCWQEFEQYCHETVEAGSNLDADELTEKWIELSKKYYGDGIEFGEYGQYRWLTLATLYNNYYQYQYATDLCYATVLSQNIINGVPGAREKYMEFLKTGAAVPTIDALTIAGIDIYDDNVYEQAFDYFEGLVDEFEELVKKYKN